MMGMGMMASGRNMFPGNADKGTVFVETIGSDDIGASLEVPALFLDQSEVITVQVFDAISRTAIADAKVIIFIREGLPSSSSGQQVSVSSPDVLEPVRITLEGTTQFIYIPQKTGNFIIEARISYPPHEIDHVLVLQIRHLVGEISETSSRMTRLTATAIIGGLSMLAIMALFMWGGHGHCGI